MKKSPAIIVIVMLAYFTASSLPTTNPFYYDPSLVEQIRSNLYQVESDASTTLLDGDLTQYDPSYANIVDGLDARKMSNFAENLGMVRENTTLVIERRHTIETTDTIFYKLWNVEQKKYQLEFIISNLNHPGLNGFLEDSYLHSSTPLDLDGPNNINFAVNADPASAVKDRFRIVFAAATPSRHLPLSFKAVKAYHQSTVNKIDWVTKDGFNIKSFNVERSADGKQFSAVSDITAINLASNNYTWIDASPVEGDNYYRISIKDANGQVSYSEVQKVSASKLKGDMKVFPNPVTDNTIHLQIANQPEGVYDVKLVNISGQVVMTKQIQHAGGTNTETIRPAQQVPKGIYQLEITKPDGTKMNLHLMY